MQFNVVNNWDALPQSAASLFIEGLQESIFLSREWFENLVSQVFDDQELCLVYVESKGKVLALMPLLKKDDGYFQSLTHLYSSYYSLLVSGDDKKNTLQCLRSGLCNLGCKMISFDSVAKNDSKLAHLKQYQEEQGASCHQKFKFYNWFHCVNGESFEVYFSNRPSKLRNTIKRKGRKLDREYGYKIRLFIEDDLEEGLRDYHSVYQSSWKANEQFAHIINGFAGKVSSLGWIRLAVLYVDTTPVATQLWFVAGGKASIFRLAYDEEWKQYSVGSILTAYLMKHVIDVDQVSEIDFLTGNETYKQDWMSERRERWNLVCGCEQQNTQRRNQRLKQSLKALFRI